MAIFFFVLSVLSIALIIISRLATTWGWPIPPFADSWEQVGIWAIYALVLCLIIGVVVFILSYRKTKGK
jgi:hypothetical protein